MKVIIIGWKHLLLIALIAFGAGYALNYFTFGADHRQFQAYFGEKWPHNDEERDIDRASVAKVLAQKQAELARFDAKLNSFVLVMNDAQAAEESEDTSAHRDAYEKLRHQYTELLNQRKQIDDKYYDMGCVANAAGYDNEFLRKFGLVPRNGFDL